MFVLVLVNSNTEPPELSTATFPFDLMVILLYVDPPVAVEKYKSAAFVDSPPLPIASPI